MISTSTVLHGAARVTITGFLAVSFFKKTAADHAAKVIQKAERITILTIGLAAADFCLSTVILLLASDRTARKLLSGDFNQKHAPDSPPFPGNNIADIFHQKLGGTSDSQLSPTQRFDLMKARMATYSKERTLSPSKTPIFPLGSRNWYLNRSFWGRRLQTPTFPSQTAQRQ
ncbi:hypothetical protein F4604DRAFT_1913999 [Suillus subluteus]|nr:hypothetical protein F4604DRAFT_1913999 [Suillus subluteus]